jgi:O-antigen ligase
VVLAPSLSGGSPAWSQLLASAGAFVLFAGYLIGWRGGVSMASFVLPATLAAAFTLVQLVPLPAGLVGFLSPLALEVRTEAARAAPALLPLTLDVPATVIALIRGLACLGLLVVVAAVAGATQRARVLLITLALVGGALAVVALLGRSFWPDQFLGPSPPQDKPGSGFFATFVNGNHIASLLGLSALISMGLAIESSGALRGAAAASAALSVTVLLATGSRAGAAAFALGATIFVALVGKPRWGWARALALAGLLLALASAAGLAANDLLRSRMFPDNPATLWDNQKTRGWRASLNLAADYPWTGVGRGAFEAPATAYRKQTEGVRLSNPENILLQTSTEWGFPVTALLAVLVGLAAFRVGRVLPKLEPSTQAAACGVLAVLLHEMADFGLETTGVALPTVVALAVVVARAERVREKTRPEARPLPLRMVAPAAGVWALALAGAAWALPRTLEADGSRALRAVQTRAPDGESQIAAAIRRHPADYYLELLAATHAMAVPPAQRKVDVIQRLNRALTLYPADGASHALAARWLAGNGRRSQAAIEYRLALEAGADVSLTELFAALGPELVASAVPQAPDSLLDAANFLLGKGRVNDADQLSRRALQLAGDRERAAVARAQLALGSEAAPFRRAAGGDLLEHATRPESYGTAARTLQKGGDLSGADRALAEGLAAHANNGSLVLIAAQLQLERGDLDGASRVLRTNRSAVFSLAERASVEQLLADIAEKAGDTAGATAARARARALLKMQSAN